MKITIVGKEAESALNWLDLIEALKMGHSRPRADLGDTFLYRGNDTLLNRVAWIDGMGSLVKTANVFPANPDSGLGTVQGAVNLYSDTDGTLEALVDFHLVTKYKTAGDSLLGASLLARPDSREIVIIGAGTVGHSLRQAYGALFPEAHFSVWNRTAEKAEVFANQYPNTDTARDLEAAVRAADIVTSATMSTDPILKGAWLQPGQHIDLIGAYRPDMREADDDAIRRATIHVDSRATTIGHIGEIQMPIDSGIIQESSLVSDFYDIADGKMRRNSPDEITLFKNGGGAHLDLMTSRYILDAWQKGLGR